MSTRKFISDLTHYRGQEILLRGWVYRLRVLAKTTFIVMRDCTGIVQCVIATEAMQGIDIGVEDVVEVVGTVHEDARAAVGFEVQASRVVVLNQATRILPFHSNANPTQVGIESLLEYRSLALRTEWFSDIFKVQGAILREFRNFLSANHFTEIVTSKIVASGTEGGTNLFELKYFDRAAYLAQSPQFYKEQCVGAFERVFETGHVYRAEPHATSRHLTEYYSLDLEVGFIESPEEVIELERQLLTAIFESLNSTCEQELVRHGQGRLPSMMNVSAWEFSECLERLKVAFNRTELVDDLDSEAERQLCRLAEAETGVPAVFVIGFPLSARPFYVAPRGSNGAAQSFDLLFRGLEITTGGQRIHRRAELEAVLRSRGIDPTSFESHLAMFDLGMPPHGGLGLGLERLTAQVLGLSNVRDATLYPRDRYRLTP
jgi:nondiscriminating aspartyl-tRNA synthetase